MRGVCGGWWGLQIPPQNGQVALQSAEGPAYRMQASSPVSHPPRALYRTIRRAAPSRPQSAASARTGQKNARVHCLGGQWRESLFSGKMSVGLNTRTKDRRATLGGVAADARWSLGGLCSAVGCALAGAPTWPFWPGAVRHVQRETLKAYRPVSLAGVQLPAARSVHRATALNSRT